MQKRLLLITYFFPPYNLTEHRRALLTAQTAVNDGWDVDVIAPWAPDFHSGSSFPNWIQRFKSSDRLRVHRTTDGLHDSAPLVSKGFDRFLDHVKGGGRLRKLTRFPDRRASWLYFVVPRAIWLACKIRPHVVLTTSYPYTPHVVGYILSMIFHRPWIVDMHDSWAVDDAEQFTMLEPSPRLRKWHRSLMSTVGRRATQVWSITPDIRDATASLFPDQDPHKFLTVVHGYDLNSSAEDEKTAKHRQITADRSDFVLGYAGRFLPDITPADPIIIALHELKERNQGFYSRVRLRVWTFDPKAGYDYIYPLISKYRVEDRIDFCNALPEDNLISTLGGCDALLVTNGSSDWTQKRLTTKLFVYLAAKRPILAICEPGSAISKLIQQANLGPTIPPGDPSQIADTLEGWVRARDEAGQLSFQPNAQILEQYSLQKGVMPLIAKKLNQAMVESIPHSRLRKDFHKVEQGRGSWPDKCQKW